MYYVCKLSSCSKFQKQGRGTYCKECATNGVHEHKKHYRIIDEFDVLWSDLGEEYNSVVIIAKKLAY